MKTKILIACLVCLLINFAPYYGAAERIIRPFSFNENTAYSFEIDPLGTYDADIYLGYTETPETVMWEIVADDPNTNFADCVGPGNPHGCCPEVAYVAPQTACIETPEDDPATIASSCTGAGAPWECCPEVAYVAPETACVEPTADYYKVNIYSIERDETINLGNVNHPNYQIDINFPHGGLWVVGVTACVQTGTEIEDCAKDNVGNVKWSLSIDPSVATSRGEAKGWVVYKYLSPPSGGGIEEDPVPEPEPEPLPLTETDCFDGVDNDADGKKDCYDTDCLVNAECERKPESCLNGLDDDFDGKTDCADSDCIGSEPSCPAFVDNFSARFTRTLSLDEGTYTFKTISDDGVRLWINGELKIDVWTTHAARTDVVTLPLAAGNYDLKLEWFEAAGQARIELSWTQDSATGETNPNPINGNWVGEYFKNKDLSGEPFITRDEGSGFIKYNWDNGGPVF